MNISTRQCRTAPQQRTKNNTHDDGLELCRDKRQVSGCKSLLDPQTSLDFSGEQNRSASRLQICHHPSSLQTVGEAHK